MKLWVDDIREAPDESWSVARTPLSAIRAISHFHFEEISLDHDSGLDDDTFASVAYYIACAYSDLPRHARPKVTIHSANPIGAEEMKMVLRSGGIEANLITES